MHDVARRSIAEIITDLGGELMREVGIPGELTSAILSFAIDIGPEDFRWHNDQMLSDVMISPEDSSFCRSTAARLFDMFRTDPIEHMFECAVPPELPPDTERLKQVFASTVSLARDVGTAVVGRSRAVCRWPSGSAGSWPRARADVT
jgi:hypothetical protein